MYVRPGQSAPRRTFTEAHELVHALCPGTSPCCARTPRPSCSGRSGTRSRPRRTPARRCCCSRARRSRALAAAEPPSLAAVRALAEMHGASLHATLHHYAQSRPDAVAMLIAGRFPRKDGSLPVWRCVESGTFRERFGPAAALAAGGLAPGTALRDLVEAARTAGDASAAVLGRGARRLRAEAHYNRHAFLVLVVGDPEPARPRPRPGSARASRPGLRVASAPTTKSAPAARQRPGAGTETRLPCTATVPSRARAGARRAPSSSSSCWRSARSRPPRPPRRSASTPGPPAATCRCSRRAAGRAAARGSSAPTTPPCGRWRRSGSTSPGTR